MGGVGKLMLNPKAALKLFNRTVANSAARQKR